MMFGLLPGSPMLRFSSLLMLALGLMVLKACALNPATGDNDLVFMSENQEIALGREYHKEVVKQYEPFADQELQDYVQAVGEKVASVSHRGNLYYRFTVLDSPDINAFALPGGYIYIHRGLLTYMNSEAELAAVLAHEVGHVTARHAVRRHTSATLAGIFSTAVAVGTGQRAAADLASLLGQAVTRGYGREHELEADGLGASYLARAGYDPQAMVEVIGLLKMQQEFSDAVARESGDTPSSYHGLFATHPRHDTRLQQVVGQAVLQGGEGRVGREAFLAAIDNVDFGDSTQAGVRRGNRFYHKPLAFTVSFPDQWRILNYPSAVIGHTVLKDGFVQMTLEDLNKRITPEEFIRERLGVKKLRAGEPLSQSGLEGYTGIAPGGMAGGKLHRVGVVYYRRQAYIFRGWAEKQRGFDELDADFLASIRSFRPLRAEEQHLAESLKLKVHTARRGDTFARLASRSRIPNHPEAQLRLLNGMYPDGELSPGSRIKIVR